jgi:starch-binding outer membrane protein, SusD/RagB family
MQMTRLVTLALGGVLALAVPACDLSVPDLNNPGLDELESNPTAVSVGAACTGLLIGNRGNVGAENGSVDQLGILGREAYNFDQADPRYVGELIQGPLNPGGPFGGNFWQLPYANLRLGAIILVAVDKVSELSDEQKSGIRGFTKTIAALDLLAVIVTRDDNGAVIDIGRSLDEALPPIVGKAETYAKIASLLDDGASDLGKAGDSFPFLLSEGYSGFTTPPTFLTFNRALRARVAVYTKDYATALTALAGSFIDDSTDEAPDFNVGVYHSYSTKSGDVVNGLINPNIYAHPSLETDAMKNGTIVDLRYTRKVAKAKKAGAAMGLSSTLQFTPLYPGPTSPISILRNEELILLKAEALFFTGMVAQAVIELNIVRQGSGGLPALVGLPSEATFISQLLYERRYSLLFEGGHRWIDLRRFNQPLPLDKPDDTRNVRYPIPLTECNARPNDAACGLGST